MDKKGTATGTNAMQRQKSLMLEPPAGAASWVEKSLLDERTTAALTGVNAAFVSLALELHATRPGLPVLGLAGHLVPALARARRALEAGLQLPYALFDLRFRDTQFWKAQSAGSCAVQDGTGAPAADPRLVRFTGTAVTLAWHLAQIDGRVARLAFGLESDTQALLAALPVGTLGPLARRVAPSLAARFCTRDRFWQLLSDGLSRTADVERVGRIKLLGLQLQGADAARAQRLHRRARRSSQA